MSEPAVLLDCILWLVLRERIEELETRISNFADCSSLETMARAHCLSSLGMCSWTPFFHRKIRNRMVILLLTSREARCTNCKLKLIEPFSENVILLKPLSVNNRYHDRDVLNTRHLNKICHVQIFGQSGNARSSGYVQISEMGVLPKFTLETSTLLVQGDGTSLIYIYSGDAVHFTLSLRHVIIKGRWTPRNPSQTWITNWALTLVVLHRLL